jgi:pimeloyl-ACP methyl ester carboxylesterase
MKRIRAFVLIGAAFLGLGWAAFQAVAPVEPLSKYFPPGALLYLQTSDFLALLADWNASPQKQEWLRSSNYEVFSRSRLLLRPVGSVLAGMMESARQGPRSYWCNRCRHRRENAKPHWE